MVITTLKFSGHFSLIIEQQGLNFNFHLQILQQVSNEEYHWPQAGDLMMAFPNGSFTKSFSITEFDDHIETQKIDASQIMFL